MQETAVRFAICDDDKTYAEKMKALILQTFQLPQPVECDLSESGTDSKILS